MKRSSRRPTRRTISILIAPDKFKGTLTAKEVAERIAEGISNAPHGNYFRCDVLPLADGGDGSLDAAVAAGFTRVPITVHDPAAGARCSSAAFDGTTAVVEVASTCGLASLPSGSRDPMNSTSHALGEALIQARRLGARRVVIALGGSASTDGGAGLLAALGARFFDASGTRIVPSGGTLTSIAAVDLTELQDWSDIELIAATDVTNPLLGPNGAAPIFGPQKGADTDEVLSLANGLGRLVEQVALAGRPLSYDFASHPGAGSAGGIGYGCLILGARLVSGAAFFLDLLHFDDRAADQDFIVTGEGALDRQTAFGKLVSVVAKRAGESTVIAVVGRNTVSHQEARALHIDRVLALSERTNQDTSRDPDLSARLLVETGRELAEDLWHSREREPLRLEGRSVGPTERPG